MENESLTQLELIKDLSFGPEIQEFLSSPLYSDFSQETRALFELEEKLAPTTAAHSRGVMNLLTILNRHYIQTQELGSLKRIALLHDIGKVAEPIRGIVEGLEPVQKNSRELELIKLHSIVSFCILQEKRYPSEDLIPVLLHHRDYNGISGYPILNNDLPDLVAAVGNQLGICIDKGLVPTSLPTDPTLRYRLYLLTLADQVQAAVDPLRRWRNPICLEDTPEIFANLFGIHYAPELRESFLKTIQFFSAEDHRHYLSGVSVFRNFHT